MDFTELQKKHRRSPSNKLLSKKRRTRLNILRKDSGIHSAVRRTLFSCRLMGLLPLCGLDNADSGSLKFTLKTSYVFVYAVSAFGQILMSSLTLFRQIKSGSNMLNFTNSIFYTSGLVSTVVILGIGATWPRMVKKVEGIELKLPPFYRNVSSSCNLLMVFVLITALVEHLLSVFYGLKISISCNPDNIWETYFIQSMPWIFDLTPYSLWKGIVGEIFNIQATFLWSFNDLFVMVCSIYLAEHFSIHNDLVKKIYKKEKYNWHEYRKQYWLIVKLVKLINKQIGVYVLTSFGCNLYWICMQLFNSLNTNNTGHILTCTKEQNNSIQHIEHTFYFAYSFSFLVLRTLLVALLAARIHSSALTPLTYLYDVPTMNYNIEVQRYIDQIKYTTVALSGLDFFYVTRGMILTLIGTIVTYELVLLQFNIGSLIQANNDGTQHHPLKRP